jgi:cardiolipin synthase (CMP-forming)
VTVRSAVMRRTGDDRILTVPNAISIVRLVLIPVFVWLLLGREDRRSAVLLLAALGATDWVDGYIARHFDQGSTLGKIIDPVADRLLLATGIAAILIDGSVPRWLGFLVVGREVLVSVAVVAIAAMGARRIDVQWAGKAQTMGWMIVFPLFLAARAKFSWSRWADDLAWVITIPTLAFMAFATITYVPIARSALAEGRAARAPS